MFWRDAQANRRVGVRHNGVRRPTDVRTAKRNRSNSTRTEWAAVSVENASVAGTWFYIGGGWTCEERLLGRTRTGDEYFRPSFWLLPRAVCLSAIALGKRDSFVRAGRRRFADKAPLPIDATHRCNSETSLPSSGQRRDQDDGREQQGWIRSGFRHATPHRRPIYQIQ